MSDELAARLEAVRGRIRAACARAKRPPGAVTLVAVSKTKPEGAIRLAYAAGQRDFGENYAQELRDKRRALADLPELRWHFIGPLQRNKARMVTGVAALLHSISSVEQLLAVEQAASRQRLAQDVLLQVNLAGEQRKAGLRAEDVPELLARFGDAPHVRCAGLMTIPPLLDDPAANAPLFAALRRLRDGLGGAQALPQLSMGMSDDFEIAIAEGATLVRVGSAIFGAR